MALPKLVKFIHYKLVNFCPKFYLDVDCLLLSHDELLELVFADGGGGPSGVGFWTAAVVGCEGTSVTVEALVSCAGDASTLKFSGATGLDCIGRTGSLTWSTVVGASVSDSCPVINTTTKLHYLLRERPPPI